MSGKEAATAASVKIDDEAVPMEGDRSLLYTASRSGATAGDGTWALVPPHGPHPRSVAALGTCLPTLQNAGAAVVSLWQLCGSVIQRMPAECRNGSEPDSESEPGSE